VNSKMYRPAVFPGLAFVVFLSLTPGCSVDSNSDITPSQEKEGGVGDAGGEDDGDGGAVPGDAAEGDARASDAGAGGVAPGMEAGSGDSSADTGGGDGGGGGGCVEVPTEGVCGDGVLDEGERCDDGNSDDGDGCESDCTFTCSDPESDCGADVAGDCLRPVCVAVSSGAVCGSETDETDLPDDGNFCTIDFCDGSVPGHSNRDNGDACDNGSGLAGDYCKQGTCIEPVCGDGVEGPLEQCDDGNTDSGDLCSSDCMLEECGDGNLDIYEDCDDGNSDDGDGCDNDCEFTCSDAESDCPADVAGDCQAPVCVANANGQVCGLQADTEDVPVSETECLQGVCSPGPAQVPVDDGIPCDNQTDEPGDYCYGGVCIDPVCGDRVRGPLEECDHEGLINGIGCSSECEIECPEFMVRVLSDIALGVERAFCMDKYEASRSDATSDSMGDDTSMAVSQPNVIPWSSNPMNGTVLSNYKAACIAAGKHLCSKQQWYVACTGPDRTTYAFGNTFDPETCNCVATFCDDYCVEHGIDMGSCYTSTFNCGYYCGEPPPEFTPDYYNICFHVEPTGQYPGCDSVSGAMDVCGNVWEIVPSADDPRGYEIRGGAFSCAAPSGSPTPPYGRLKCIFNATWDSLDAGFRCCADIE
jgi:cysteine-rich repeat protein